MNPSDIASRLLAVRERVDRAAVAAGREPLSVKLLAVSKTRGPAEIRAAWGAGQRAFGENYVQELVAKYDELHDLASLEWHAIGHVQSNKAAQIARCAHTIHSVDSIKLVRELERRCAAVQRSKPLEVLVQVNIAREPQKSGCAPEDTSVLLDEIERSTQLRLRGLMTIPPESEDPESSREHFLALATLRSREGGATRLPELSMGMSHDVEVAVACGATWVRVGQAIFGARSDPTVVRRLG